MNPLTDGKPIEGFPAYRVTTDGQVWTCLKRRTIGRGYAPSEDFRPMKIGYAKSGKLLYRRIALCQADEDGLQHSKYVHVLVLEAFVGPCPTGMQCRHHDNNPQNNNLSNLSWATPLVNQHDRRVYGTTIEGVKHGRSKLDDVKIAQIRDQYAKGGVKQKDIGEQFGIRQSHVSRIIRRQNWSHIKEQEISYVKD